jgi:predicted MPP superfamily phosphohydrolase
MNEENNEKVEIKPKTKKKHKGLIITFSIIGGIIGCLALVLSVFAIGSTVVTNNLLDYAKSFDKVEYDHTISVPKKDNNGYYYFSSDGEFNVMQLTDVHLGSGIMSKEKDKKALNAIASLVSTNKPDLVIFTGDESFPVPYISGTLNNQRQPNLIANLMETLGVYWTVVFGNHDSEAYNYYRRGDVENFYSSYHDNGYTHCLFDGSAEGVSGNCNNVINLKSSSGLVRNSFITLDSNAYLDNDPLGINWIYDNIHQDEIAWYESVIDLYTSENKKIHASSGTVQSMLFFHIPLPQFQDALFEYKDNNFKDTANTKYIYGECGEDQNYLYHDESHVVWSGENRDDSIFEAILNKGSTKAIFCGHDHLNNFSFIYKGIQLTYGYSIDYLAYKNIDKYGRQRGCTNISFSSSENYEITHENYYLRKFVSKYPKETVTMDKYYENNTYLMNDF